MASDSRGFGRVDDLLEAYDQKDDDKFKDLIKKYLTYAVDNEVFSSLWTTKLLLLFNHILILFTNKGIENS